MSCSSDCFPMGDPLLPCVYLAPLWRYGALWVIMYTERRNDGTPDEQKEKSLNFYQCSLCSPWRR